MSFESNSKYYDAFASIVKITLRDGYVAEEEMMFLKHLSVKLQIPAHEYEDVRENYLYKPIQPLITYKERLEALHRLTQIIDEDYTIAGDIQNKWVNRMVVGLGFNPVNAKYIGGKAMDLVKLGVDTKSFVYEIQNLNR
ncbi:TerB family tellurite resistance protein [Spongiivirga sp. MCCC 1A20706]|uniref:TerB family tellurite resistance protein n=1 Tax=Spongiivirga sp. MCCC 1A20706 TaxID=3160963 RepID=UPI0039775E10